MCISAADNAAKLLKCSRKDLFEAIGFGGPNPDDVCDVILGVFLFKLLCIHMLLRIMLKLTT